MIEFVHPTPWNLPLRRAVIKVRRVTGPRGSGMSGMAADEEVAPGLVSGEEVLARASEENVPPCLLLLTSCAEVEKGDLHAESRSRQDRPWPRIDAAR